MLEARRIMLSFDLRSFQRRYHQIPITCAFDDLAVVGTTKYLSPRGLCLQIPTTRIKMGLLEMLNKDVLLEVKTVTIEGCIGWYTIDADRYCIGITIHKKHLQEWKRIVSQSADAVLNAGMNHARI